MSIKLYLLLIGLCFTLGGIMIFLWALKSRQFDEVEDVKYKMLSQDD